MDSRNAMKTLVLLGAALMIALMGGSPVCAESDLSSDAEAFDIAPFALPNTPPGEIRFEEPRDVVAVVAEFKEAAPNSVGLSYLQRTWPETRTEERFKTMMPSRFGWTDQDDLFNTKWREAAVEVRQETENRVRITFKGLKTEFPDYAEYDVTFRRTLGVRIDAPSSAALEKVQVFTASAPSKTALRVTLDAGNPTPTKSLRFEGYNLEIESVNDLQGFSGDAQGLQGADAGARQFTIAVRHMLPAHEFSGDDGLLTFVLDDDAVTISLVSLEKEGPVWAPDFGLFVTRAGDPVTFESYRASHAEDKTIRERVLDREEQCLSGAMHGQPRPHSVSYNLGCTHARQRFWVEANGDLLLFKRNVTWVEGKDTERFKCGDNARFIFGLEKWYALARFVDPEPALVFNLHARQGALFVEEKAFALPLMTPIESEAQGGDDTMAALVRFRFRNDGDAPVTAALPLSYSQHGNRAQNRYDSHDGYEMPPCPLDKLSLEGNNVVSRFKNEQVMRCAIDTAMDIAAQDDRIGISKTLAPGESCEVILKIPYVALDSNAEESALNSMQFDQAYQQVTDYWREVGRRGARLATPEPALAALHASHLAHVLITDFLMPDGSGLINTSVGTSTYGNFTNESCMIVNELEQRGMSEEARKRVELWVKYQGTVPQPGNFTDYDGMYFGAGGFEQGSYNQHHGWALWSICQHYFYTRDADWFQSVADSVIAGADWVFRQRRNTMTDLPHSRGWEYGFLPAGSLEDVTDFYYWLSTNSLTWRAADAAARALEAVRHPEAARIRKEADAYRADLIRGFENARRYAPLVRLRNGQWVPDYPSRLYHRGREVGWIRETLEGSVYLLLSGLYDANSRQAEWILDDFQDNRYPSPPFGYLIPEFEYTWFDRAGLSVQPNLLAGLLPYLDRDDPDVYVWMFYNDWAACYRPEINAMVEHPMPVLGYSNTAHFKTSDEANAVSWLRYMFVYEHGDLLHFGRAIPRAWFAQSEPFEASDVMTTFGKAGVRYTPSADQKRITAQVTLNLEKQPRKMLVRFRDPEKRPVRAVRVNGQPRPAADPERGDVDITGEKGNVEIEVEY